MTHRTDDQFPSHPGEPFYFLQGQRLPEHVVTEEGILQHENESRRFVHGSFLDLGRKIINVFRGGTVEPVDNLFKKGVDTLDDVLEGENNKFTSAEDKARIASALIDGVAAGGVWPFDIWSDTDKNGVPNPGEVWYGTTQPGTFTHPNGNQFTVSGNTTTVTTWEPGSNPAVKASYLMFVGSDKSRFTMAPNVDTPEFKEFLRVEFRAGKWYYDNNLNTDSEFTPNPNDCIVGKITHDPEVGIGALVRYAAKTLFVKGSDTLDDVLDGSGYVRTTPEEKEGAGRGFVALDTDGQLNLVGLSGEALKQLMATAQVLAPNGDFEAGYAFWHSNYGQAAIVLDTGSKASGTQSLRVWTQQGGNNDVYSRNDGSNVPHSFDESKTLKVRVQPGDVIHVSGYAKADPGSAGRAGLRTWDSLGNHKAWVAVWTIPETSWTAKGGFYVVPEDVAYITPWMSADANPTPGLSVRFDAMRWQKVDSRAFAIVDDDLIIREEAIDFDRNYKNKHAGNILRAPGSAVSVLTAMLPLTDNGSVKGHTTIPEDTALEVLGPAIYDGTINSRGAAQFAETGSGFNETGMKRITFDTTGSMVMRVLTTLAEGVKAVIGSFVVSKGSVQDMTDNDWNSETANVNAGLNTWIRSTNYAEISLDPAKLPSFDGMFQVSGAVKATTIHSEGIGYSGTTAQVRALVSTNGGGIWVDKGIIGSVNDFAIGGPHSTQKGFSGTLNIGNASSVIIRLYVEAFNSNSGEFGSTSSGSGEIVFTNQVKWKGLVGTALPRRGLFLGAEAGQPHLTMEPLVAGEQPTAAELAEGELFYDGEDHRLKLFDGLDVLSVATGQSSNSVVDALATEQLIGTSLTEVGPNLQLTTTTPDEYWQVEWLLWLTFTSTSSSLSVRVANGISSAVGYWTIFSTTGNPTSNAAIRFACPGAIGTTFGSGIIGAPGSTSVVVPVIIRAAMRVTSPSTTKVSLAATSGQVRVKQQSIMRAVRIK